MHIIVPDNYGFAKAVERKIRDYGFWAYRSDENRISVDVNEHPIINDCDVDLVGVVINGVLATYEDHIPVEAAFEQRYDSHKCYYCGRKHDRKVTYIISEGVGDRYRYEFVGKGCFQQILGVDNDKFHPFWYVVTNVLPEVANEPTIKFGKAFSGRENALIAYHFASKNRDLSLAELVKLVDKMSNAYYRSAKRSVFYDKRSDEIIGKIVDYADSRNVKSSGAVVSGINSWFHRKILRDVCEHILLFARQEELA